MRPWHSFHVVFLGTIRLRAVLGDVYEVKWPIAQYQGPLAAVYHNSTDSAVYMASLGKAQEVAFVACMRTCVPSGFPARVCSLPVPPATTSLHNRHALPVLMCLPCCTQL